MEKTSPWRVWAKRVAITDIFILWMDILGVLFLVLLLASYGDIWILTLVIIAAVFVIGIQLRAAVSLLLATELGIDHKEALKNARIWTRVTIVFLIISIIGCITALAITTLIITLVGRGVGLYIVHKFMKDTECFINFQLPGNDPADVTVNK